jgi:hypothetical protein
MDVRALLSPLLVLRNGEEVDLLIRVLLFPYLTVIVRIDLWRFRRVVELTLTIGVTNSTKNSGILRSDG